MRSWRIPASLRMCDRCGRRRSSIDQRRCPCRISEARSGTQGPIATRTSIAPDCAGGCRATRSTAVPHVSGGQHRVGIDPVQRPTSTRSPRACKQGVYEAGGIPMDLPSCRWARPRSSRRRCCGATWRRWPPKRCFRANRSTLVLLAGATRRSGAADGGRFRGPARVRGPGGPMLSGTFRGRRPRMRHRCVEAVGGGSRRDAVAAGLLAVGVIDDPEPRVICNTMGTAVDHGAVAEALRHRRSGHRPASPRAGQPTARGPTPVAVWLVAMVARAAAAERVSGRGRS